MKLLLKAFLAAAIQWKSEMTSDLNNGYDFINFSTKFEKFLSYSINMPSFIAVRGQCQS